MAGPSLKQRWASIKSAIRFGGYPAYSTYGGHGIANMGSPINFSAGNPEDNSIVSATLGWIGRTYPEAPIEIVRKTAKGEEPVPNHPLFDLLNEPNPFYSDAEMWTPVMMSYILDGNAYLLKERTNGGDVLYLWYVPHWTMEPRWPSDGSQFISHYDYRVDGKVTRYDVADVVHLPNGRDPRNMRKGLSQLKSATREIYTDNEITEYEAWMLTNKGFPGAIFSPGSPDQTFTKEQAAFISQEYYEKTTGANRGKAIVSLGSLKVDSPAFGPGDMNLRQMRWTPEERISALIGIPAIVVGLGAGLEHGTYQNTSQAREAAYESYLMPVQASIDRALTKQLMPDFGGEKGVRVAHDYTKVRVLQPDADKLAERAAKLFTSGMIDRAHSLTMIGEDAEPGDEGIYFLPRGGSFSDGTIAEPVAPQTVPVDTEPGASTPTVAANGNGKQPTDAAALAALTKPTA